MASSTFISPFASQPGKVWPGQGDFDIEYVKTRVKRVVKKTGDGDEDYVIVKKFVEERVPIQEVLDKDKGSTGIKAILERVALTGDPSLVEGLAAAQGEQVNDFTGMPKDLMEADLMAKRAVEAYNRLPDALKKGRSFTEFCNSFTNDEYALWVASLVNENKSKTEEKKEGEE